MEKLYAWHTKIGPFYIAESEGQFEVFYKDDALGRYPNSESALAKLTDDHKFAIAGGARIIPTATLDIPESLNRWSRLL